MSATSRPVARFRFVILFALVSLIGAAALAVTISKKATQQAVESSVVKIFVHSNPPDLLSPWQKAGTEMATGSGVIIVGNRILTNAHVIEDAVNIEVKRADMSERVVAEVSFVGHEYDLAILTVEEERFFKDVQGLNLGEMPEIQDTVKVYGFPIGGETISVTSGIMSRVEVSTYSHSMEDLLIAQIDASINAGNSGGPVIAGKDVVGIALQSLEEGENVGYMIPAPVIRHFLDDVADGRYDGLPRLGVEFQGLESEAHRASLGMDKQQTGALVSRVDHGSPVDSLVKPGDVLLEIDGHQVANDGNVTRRQLGQVHLSDVYQSKQLGDKLSLSILRDGKRISEEVALKPHQILVPGRRTMETPQYLVFGGLVFQPLTLEYLRYFEEIPADLENHAFYQNVVSSDRRQIILIQKVLPHPINRGYQDWEDYVVETVNGVVPRDMQHLARIIDDAEGPWLKIVTENKSYLTIDIAEARSVHQSLLSNFGITSDRSPSLTQNGLTTQAEAR